MPLETLNECLRSGVSRFLKDDAFLGVNAAGEVYAVSSRDFYHRARLATLGLNAMEIQKGDRVALISENRFEWALVDLAVLNAGAVTVPLYTNASREQTQYILKDSGAKAAAVSKGPLLEKILEAGANLPDLKHIVTFERTGREDGQTILHLSDLEAKGAPVWEQNQDLHRQLLEAPKAEDLATIVYTSGTTGEPKGVMLTQGNLASNVLACADRVEFRSSDRALSFLPLSHIFERLLDYLYFFSGVSIVHVPDPFQLRECVKKTRPTIFTAVPRFYEKLHDEILDRASSNFLKRALARWSFKTGQRYAEAVLGGAAPPAGLALRYRLADAITFSRIRRAFGPVRLMISGGAPLSPELGKFFYAAGMCLTEGYGLTETSPVISQSPLEHPKYGTVGTPLRGVEVRIAEDGELLVKGPNVMPGYWNKEEATKRALTEDGWLRTGDLAALDGDGYLSITGRKKDIIVTAAGKNVAPQAIEALLKRSPYIEQAVAVGDKRKFIVALIVPSAQALEGKSASEAHQAIERDAARHMAGLSDYERVRRFAFLEKPLSVEDGTLTPTFKVRRHAVEEKYKDVIERLYK
ncbi:MAG: long-chain fatty acid--CoA ligase [Acidobacteriota bacterium]|nr:MAG: long-chain fatty acid--CoA ligase [Acidobacteriota bacterium]